MKEIQYPIKLPSVSVENALAIVDVKIHYVESLKMSDCYRCESRKEWEDM